jgi:hypothetical protein
MIQKIGIVSLLVFVGCFGPKSAPTTALFNGECRVEVESKTDHSEIMVDSVEVGHDKVLLQVPCGERYIEVRKPGYVPYAQYLPVSVERPLSVSVTLNKRQQLPNLALEASLIDKVRGPIVAVKKSAQEGTSEAKSDSQAPAATEKQSDRYEDWL